MVKLSIAWSNLAAVNGDRLTVTEPFASGFEPDRTFSIAAPDGNTLTSVEPESSESDEASVTWEAGTSLEDFEVVVEPMDTDRDGETGGETPAEDTTEDTPGFGAGVALAALLSVVLLASHRR